VIRQSRSRFVTVLLAGVCVAAVTAVAAVRFVQDDRRRHYLGVAGWPSRGQGAYVIAGSAAHAGPGQRAVPIASVAKVMTARLVLRAAPLRTGFHLVVTAQDVVDTQARVADGESTVPVAAGEVLSERQALAALLLPSANNIAIMLARRVAGSVAAFVVRMNREARRLGMTRTRYTDPSGLASSTRSTAADQLILAVAALRQPTLAHLVALRSYSIPVAGTIRNTDSLLGSDGVVGVKTGSDDAAGGCFMFRVRRIVDGRRTTVTGVVLGQEGHNLITAGLYAGLQLANRALEAALPGPGSVDSGQFRAQWLVATDH
jgi:D-alanyl-D-alanine carboxypeptidase (penicillin-binding protein 5/6)